MKKVKELKKWIELYNEVHAAAEELQLAYDYVKEGIVSEEEVDEAYGNAIQLVESLEFRNMLRQEADQMSCVLKINSGAGGTESQDWASMLLRMYTRWAEANGYKISVANYQEGDEAGIKTATLNIEGDYAYGYLKGENGVHRLVRVSPYNAQGKRMTSFCHPAGRRHDRGENRSGCHLLGYVPFGRCRWAEREQGGIRSASALSI